MKVKKSRRKRETGDGEQGEHEEKVETKRRKNSSPDMFFLLKNLDKKKFDTLQMMNQPALIVIILSKAGNTGFSNETFVS